MKQSLDSETLNKNWFVLDAADTVVGRLASCAAALLRGKHKSIFMPHSDLGDFVIILNASRVQFTGFKEIRKEYWSYSGFPGGIKSVSPASYRNQRPEKIVEIAIKGMLPKGPLGRKIFGRLKIYSGFSHLNIAQNPIPLTFPSKGK